MLPPVTVQNRLQISKRRPCHCLPSLQSKREVETPPAEPTEPAEEVEEVEIDRYTTSSSEVENQGKELHEIPTAASAAQPHLEAIKTARTTAGLEKVGTRSALHQSHTQADLEQQFTLASQPPAAPAQSFLQN
jgi:MFS transporter, DHA1 family, multidrug resistance protein